MTKIKSKVTWKNVFSKISYFHELNDFMHLTNKVYQFFQMLKIVQFAKISGFYKIDFSGHFPLYLCHFGLRGKCSSLGDSNHMHHLQLLSSHHDWAFCLWPTPVSGISEFFSIGIWFWGHMRAEFKHSSTGARTYNLSVDTRALYPLCHLCCRQSVIESLSFGRLPLLSYLILSIANHD